MQTSLRGHRRCEERKEIDGIQASLKGIVKEINGIQAHPSLVLPLDEGTGESSYGDVLQKQVRSKAHAYI